MEGIDPEEYAVQMGLKTPQQVMDEAKAKREEKERLEELNRTSPYRVFPPGMDETGNRSSNVERSGSRDLTLSHWSRPIGTGEHAKTDNVRVFDGDMMVVCNRCKLVVIFMEASADENRSVTFTKKLAESVKHDAVAMRIIHAKNDKRGAYGILHLQVWLNGVGAPKIDKRNVPVQDWQILVENIVIKHELNHCGKAR